MAGRKWEAVLRTALETMARGRYFRRRLPNGVEIYVSPDSQLKYIKKQFDADLVSLAREQVSKDSVVWDVGANCGVLAFSSSHAREVVAVEADPFQCHVLMESMRMNGVPLILVSAAAFSKNGLAEFIIAKRGRASNHLVSNDPRSQTGGERARIVVPTITLDTLLDRVSPPSFVKIDVEGAEIEVLIGAKRLLTEIKPTLYLETVSETHIQCSKILSEYNYTMVQRGEGDWLCTAL